MPSAYRVHSTHMPVKDDAGPGASASLPHIPLPTLPATAVPPRAPKPSDTRGGVRYVMPHIFGRHHHQVTVSHSSNVDQPSSQRDDPIQDIAHNPQDRLPSLPAVHFFTTAADTTHLSVLAETAPSGESVTIQPAAVLWQDDELVTCSVFASDLRVAMNLNQGSGVDGPPRCSTIRIVPEAPGDHRKK